jgi:hypothetical protein
MRRNQDPLLLTDRARCAPARLLGGKQLIHQDFAVVTDDLVTHAAIVILVTHAAAAASIVQLLRE